MSWFSSDYRRQMPVIVDNRSGSATIDVSFTIPADWGTFWGVIDSNGYGLRVTASDGITPVVYKLASWTHATRTATIECDAFTPDTDNGWVVLWLYFDIDSPTDGAGSFTAASAKTGYIYHGRPTYPVFVGQPNEYGDTSPRARWQADPAEQRRLFCEIGPSLSTQEDTLNGSNRLEEPTIVTFACSNGGSAEVNAWVADSVRLHMHQGRLFASVTTKLGATTVDYLDSFTVNTSTGRVLQFTTTRNALTPAEG